MEITSKLRKPPKYFGQKKRPATNNCQDCYGDYPPSQWQVGWLIGSVLNDNGATENSPVVSFNATWEVPAAPLDPIAEVYLFTQLQSQHYIIQPCLLFYPGPFPQWFIQSVMFSYSKTPVYGERFPVSPGELINGTIEKYDGKWVVITTSEASQHRSICSLPAAEVGPILPGYGGLTLETYMLNDQNTANQLPGTSCMWFDMSVNVLGKPVDISWSPWVSDCLPCFPWLELGEGVTTLDSGTSLMKFNGSQDYSPRAKEEMSAQAKK